MKNKARCLVFVVLLLVVTSPVYAMPSLTGGTIHVVQAGQTLFSIARWHGVDLDTLARVNNIVNPSHIYVGQQLVIPDTATAQPAGGAPAVQSSGATYVVQVGDTLYSIAARYATTPWAIAQANGIYNTNFIYVGQSLVIPGTAPTTPAKPAAPAVTTPSSSSPTTAGWVGEYYSGMEPTGGPLFVRTDRAVNFRWGMSSPDTRLNTDAFSVHWTRTINFRGGLYRFRVTADDGVRMWVAGTPVLDEWRVQDESVYEVDIVLPPGSHLVAIDYFNEAGNATMQFTFKRLGDAPAEATPQPLETSTPDEADSAATDVEPTGAWLGQYFGNFELSGAPVITRTDPAINFDWGLGSPAGGIPENFFSVRWSRTAWFYEDNYLFCVRSDDGARFYVDGALVIDEWHGSNGYPNYCAEVDLVKGEHTLVIEYYEDGGDALVSVWWERH